MNTNNVEVYWQAFRPTVQQLHKERSTGKNTTGGFGSKGWWQSRYSDFLTNTNSMPKDQATWLYRYEGFKVWDSIWNKHEKEMTGTLWLRVNTTALINRLLAL